MAKRVAVHGFSHLQISYRLSDRPLDHALMQVVAPFDLRAWIDAPALGGKDPLPAPLPVGGGVFLRERIRHVYGAESRREIFGVAAFDPREPRDQIRADG